MVHFGPGAFFRAFVAPVTDAAMAAQGGDWGILAVSLRSPTARDQLVPQKGVYTSVTLTPEGPKPQIITSVVGAMVAPDDPDAVLAWLGSDQIQIVTLTITEKGYGYSPATGGLDLSHPDIAADLAQTAPPRSAVGLIVAGLAARRAAGHGPFTVLSCDNLPDNGRVTRAVVLGFAERIDPELARWIAAEGRFPSSMVDRITPATTDEDIAALAEAQGYRDLGAVVHEPFRQWVIEDDFVGDRPAWEAGGAQFVRSVAAHERMKMRCLNGTHSTLAYLGYLAGYETIAETVADPAFARLCERLWAEEIVPTLEPPQGEDLAAYIAALLERYRNPAIRHRTWQIAMDGSQKLPQRLLGTIADNRAAGRPCPGLILAVAGWMRYVAGTDDAGQPIDLRDPRADQLRAACRGASDAAGQVAALLAIGEIFPKELAEDDGFRAELTATLARLANLGSRETVARF